MSALTDVELILHDIDEDCRQWQRAFKTTTNELIEGIRELFSNCTSALIQLSISSDDNEQMKVDQLNAERIISRLKELRQCLGDIWPPNMESFSRDIFDVGPYHVEAAEFFYPVPFYPGDNFLMKLYRWSVYDTNGAIVYRYYLEKSEFVSGQPYYVIGKSYPNGHSQIQPYGAVLPDYNRMKNSVINDLKGQGPAPIISLTVPSLKH